MNIKNYNGTKLTDFCIKTDILHTESIKIFLKSSKDFSIIENLNERNDALKWSDIFVKNLEIWINSGWFKIGVLDYRDNILNRFIDFYKIGNVDEAVYYFGSPPGISYGFNQAVCLSGFFWVLPWLSKGSINVENWRSLIFEKNPEWFVLKNAEK